MSDRGDRAHATFLALQDRITDDLARIDGGPGFREDAWSRAGGGGGRTRVLENGPVIEKGGVNVSCVHGEMNDEMAAKVPGEGKAFFATGISLIIHPRSPHAPTVHANFRYLEKGEGNGARAWFGGGADLTPWILYDEDAIHFHKSWKTVCDAHRCVDHAHLKRWCDEYFFLPHRNECRGLGGIFFDYLGLKDGDEGLPAALDDAEGFVKAAGDSFLDAYTPILERRMGTPGTEAERQWQLVRRGRYVEFNLIHDRGTVFGLKTGGRIESILVSMPNLVSWAYMHEPEPGSNGADLVDLLRSPRDWAGG